MTKTMKAVLLGSLAAFAFAALGQGLEPNSILKPLSDSWPTYGGDYTQKRYSSLKQINQTNIKNLGLAWVSNMPTGAGAPGGGFGGGFPGGGGAAAPPIIGGEGPDNANTSAGRIGGAILEVNGILYVSVPNHAWAVDARDGSVLWHYFWKARGGNTIGNRGMAISGDWLYFETPDDFLVSLDAKTGKERWHKEISDFSQQHFSTMAPVLIGNHLMVGTSDDLDSPGYLQSFDPETGDLQWKHYTVPMNPGDPGLDTWKNLDAASHGGAQVWIPGSYDPETHLYIFGTGNPTPAYSSATRGDGDNLYTSCLIAVDVDSGNMKWYFQTSPHDTHDWDSTQAPVLVDADFKGKPRKMVMQAARNGFFFVLDRTTGEHLLTMKFSGAANWAKEIDKRGEPARDPEKDSTYPGSLVSPDNGGSTNWPPPSFDPDTGLFYVQLRENFAMYYMTETDQRLMMGLGGKEEDGVGALGPSIEAIDYKTGKIAWKYRFPGGATGPTSITGLLTTAGHLLFSSDLVNSIVAYDPSNGKPLWHSRIGSVSNAPETYMLDGRQYVIAAVNDTIYAFALNP
jgi:alcohol dehydrogenase (cytochrome c)